MMTTFDTLSADTLLNVGIVAILRGKYAGRWPEYADALMHGGIRALEITLNSPGALAGIAQLRTRATPNLMVGAGTVLSVEQVHAAVDAGAQFIVTPDTDESVIAACRARNVPIIPGAYTATEIKRAFNAGALAVKLFPADNPAYLKAIRAPLNHIPLMATGGVTLDNAAAFISAGAVLLGVASALTADTLPIEQVAERAAQFMQRVAAASGSET